MKKTFKLLSLAFVLAVILAFSSVCAFAVELPERPETVNVQSDFTSVTLSWDAVENAKGYRVYQMVNKSWKAIKTTTATEYTVEGLAVNSTYRFAVKPYTKADGTIYWAKSYTAVYGKTLYKPLNPAKINLDADFTSITLSWEAGENATGYRVYQSVNGKWKTLKTTTAKQFTVTGLTDTTDYKFAVKSYAKSDGVTYWASSYKTVDARTLGAPEKPAKVTAKKNASVVILSWDECLNATGYKVYQSVGGKWQVIGDVASTGFAVENLNAYTAYKFAVRPYLTADGKTYNAKSYTSLSVTTEKADVLKLTADSRETSVDLDWTNSSSADGYALYQKVDGEWVLIKELLKKDGKFLGFYYIYDLEVANTYEFAVRSFMNHGGKTYWSDYSAVSVTTDNLDKPDTPMHKNTEADTATVYWYDDLYADGYRVYVKEKGGSWQKVKDVSQGVRECVITDLKANTTYYVALKAYAKTSTGTKWSALSSSRTITVGDYTRTAITTAEAEANAVSLSWTRVPGATGYRIYNKVGTKWVALKTVTSTSHKLTGLESDTVYNLAIRAYKKVNGVTEWYAYGDTKKIITAPSAKDLTGGRYEAFREFLYTSDYSLDFELAETDGDGYSDWVESKLAFKGEDFYIGDWSFAGADDINLIYKADKDRVYIIYDDYGKYTYQQGFGEDSYELIMQYLYYTGFYYHDYDVETCIADYKGQPAVCEYFYDEAGVKVCTYYIADEFVGTELFFDGYSEGDMYYRCELKNIDKTPDSSLFRVPSGYEYVKVEV